MSSLAPCLPLCPIFHQLRLSFVASPRRAHEHCGLDHPFVSCIIMHVGGKQSLRPRHVQGYTQARRRQSLWQCWCGDEESRWCRLLRTSPARTSCWPWRPTPRGSRPLCWPRTWQPSEPQLTLPLMLAALLLFEPIAPAEIFMSCSCTLLHQNHYLYLSCAGHEGQPGNDLCARCTPGSLHAITFSASNAESFVVV